MTSEFPLPSALPPALLSNRTAARLRLQLKGRSSLPGGCSFFISTSFFYYPNMQPAAFFLWEGSLRPRRDDAVQRVVGAKYNKLQAAGPEAATRFEETSMQDK